MKAFVYILKCANDQYYVVCTHNIEERLKRHSLGYGARFTKLHLPFELVYTEEFEDEGEAFSRERQLHKWSREKKEKLIAGIL